MDQTLDLWLTHSSSSSDEGAAMWIRLFFTLVFSLGGCQTASGEETSIMTTSCVQLAAPSGRSCSANLSLCMLTGPQAKPVSMPKLIADH